MKRRTVIVSDLHVGGGAADPGDDHVYQKAQFERFATGLAASEAGSTGQIELFINGDFLEFAQTAPEAYEGVEKAFWCSERESCAKLAVILAGHPGLFAALGSLLRCGCAVTIAAGNHDVDLYWPGVQRMLRDATHETLGFALGEEWVERYGGRLQIAHGHLPDPVNTFERWADPVRFDRFGEPRLAMCPGTLFMLQFVNGIERRYPFADNLHPVQSLARVLANDDRSGFAAVAWAFLRFAVRNPAVLSTRSDTFGARLLRRVRTDDDLALALAQAAALDVPAMRASLTDEPALAEFLLTHWPSIAAAGVDARLQPEATTLGAGGAHTLGALSSGADFGKDSLRRVAKLRAQGVTATQVVVLGHTHVPDSHAVSAFAHYFNPGSWTRYVDVAKHPKLRLDDLRDESRFPYALNFVDVESDGDDAPLRAALRTFEEQRAEFSD